jgi:hypothetical protein
VFRQVEPAVRGSLLDAQAAELLPLVIPDPACRSRA